MPPLPSLPLRDPAGHKGTFGTVCVIGGRAAPPHVMIGGPAFTAAAALRSGAGLAVLAVPTPVMAAAIAIAPGATGLSLPVGPTLELAPSLVATLLDEHIGAYDCLAVGPGWGDGVPQQQILVRLLAGAEIPMVVDADGLNALASLRDVQLDLRAPVVLTPHPGEYRRLASSLGIEADPVDPDSREDAARQLAARLGCVVVLKGHGTVVSDGIRIETNRTGNVALATAGTGDVLTGVIAGLIAQFGVRRYGEEPPLTLLECALLGVHLHGRAADVWAERHGSAGLAAEDLLELIPDVLRDLRQAAE